MEKERKGLFLGQVIERDKIEFGSNNLIVAPTGSGKTHFMMNTLNNKYEGKTLMLVSTKSLKDSLGNEKGTYNSQDLRRKNLNITDSSVYVMTYAEFGNNIIFEDNFTIDYSLIICDEVHSLFQYYMFNHHHNLGKAMEYLFDVHKDKTIFYFTATTEKVDSFIDKVYDNIYRNVKIVDYTKDTRIKRLKNTTKRLFGNVDELEDVIDSFEDPKYSDAKIVMFNERIDGMRRIEKTMSERGYKAVSVWSTSNSDNPMNEEQLRVRSILLNEGIIPDEYDVVIINGAMREGWNLQDDRVEIVVANTLDETDRIQARGRVRKDIALFAYRANLDALPIDIRIMNREKSLRVIESYLGKEIDSNDKTILSDKLNVRREEDGKVVRWNTISKTLLANGYAIKNGTKRIDGKQKRFSIITKKEDVRKSSDSKASRFISSLDTLGFTKHNSEFLDKYMEKDRAVAFFHIKSSYKNYVVNDDWTQRKFADITYLLARDKMLFSKMNYNDYGTKYSDTDNVEVLTERAKYEKSAMGLLKKVKEEARKIEKREEEELLEYIAAHSGVSSK